MAVTEKRQLDDTVFSTKHILMDIEGTTTSISFVKDTLFPYVRKNLESYLGTHWNEDEFKGVLNLLKDQAVEDLKANLEGAIGIPSEGSDDDVKAAILKNVLWQMDADRKTTALKKLQGHMWRQGYKTGELKGHLFGDVAPSLREWLKEGHKLYVYSSGSVEAQKLLFGNSVEGDLTELFTDFFDTAVGAKVEADSYKAIVEKLECNADDVLFLTDLPKEASAARQAGLPVILVEREGNEPIASELRKEFSSISSFQEICFENSSKKQKVDSEEAEHPECDKANGQEEVAMETDVTQKVEDKKECDTNASGDVCPEPMDTALPSSESNDVEKKKGEAEEAEDNSPKVEGALDENQTSDKEKEDLTINLPVVADKSDSVENPEDCKSTVDSVVEVPVTDKDSESMVEKTDPLDTHAVPEAVEKQTDDKTDAKDLQQKTEEETVKESVISDKVEVEIEKKDDVKPEEESVQGKAQVEKVETDPAKKDEETEKDAVIVGDNAGSDDSAAKETDTNDASKEITSAGNVDSCEAVKTPENVDSGDRKDSEEKKSEEVEKVIVSDGSNGKGEVEEQGKTNGVSNGTNGTEKEESAGTNGTVENGHSKLGDVAEVIVAKNNTQMDNSTTDASVPVAV